MRQGPGVFEPNKVTKYFKNQKPLTDMISHFTDPLFPPNSNSIEKKDANGNIIDPTVSSDKADNLMERSTGKIPEWKTAKDIFGATRFYLFKDTIEPADVQQQEIGDCYFLSAIAADTEFPQLIYQLFRRTAVSPNGYYEVVLFIDGEWQVVILDDYFVVKKGTVKPKFS